MSVEAHPSQSQIDEAVAEALSKVLPADLDEHAHLTRAVVAERVSRAADHLSRNEVNAARTQDGANWDDVGHAFGISGHDAHDRFHTEPGGMPL